MLFDRPTEAITYEDDSHEHEWHTVGTRLENIVGASRLLA